MVRGWMVRGTWKASKPVGTLYERDGSDVRGCTEGVSLCKAPVGIIVADVFAGVVVGGGVRHNRNALCCF
jgi:hypothetical protein